MIFHRSGAAAIGALIFVELIWVPTRAMRTSSSLLRGTDEVTSLSATRGMTTNKRNTSLEVFGHRGWGCSGPGCTSTVPENSMAAFEYAAGRDGVVGAELDVWLTKDKEVVVIHGYGDDGLLKKTTVADETHRNRGVAEFTVAELKSFGGFRLREAWRTLCMREGDTSEACKALPKIPPATLLKEQEKWYRSEIPCAFGSDVPLLRDVLKRFHKRLVFNVELKGADPDVGPKVLEIAKEFPGTVARISSFTWIPPVEYPMKFDDTIPKVDLLRPLVGNDQNIPLALLFWKDIPNASNMIQCLNSYKAEWTHLPYFANNYIQDANNELPAVEDARRMEELVVKLHDAGKKALVWFGDSEVDNGDDMLESLRAGVDSLCPNDCNLALKMIHRHEREMDKEN